jgi:hypothetical protein
MKVTLTGDRRHSLPWMKIVRPDSSGRLMEVTPETRYAWQPLSHGFLSSRTVKSAQDEPAIITVTWHSLQLRLPVPKMRRRKSYLVVTET